MTIPWKRFWCPPEGRIACGEDGRGFLVDPEDEFGRIFNPDAFELGQLLDRPCLVLLGEPGMGKSTTVLSAKTEIESAFSGGQPCIWVDFRDVPDTHVFLRRTVDSAAWRAWADGNHRLTLVIDGIDEGVIKIPSFVAFLTEELREVDHSRLQVILVCRTADWPQAEGQNLHNLWPEGPEKWEFEITPLRHKDVLLAADDRIVNRQTFIQAVYNHQVIGLANRPVTLFMLLGEFSATGGFPGTHRDLYTRGCQRLCREVNEGRLELLRRIRPTSIRPPDEQIYRAACRLAAVLILSGKSAVLTANATSALSSDVRLDQVDRGTEAVGGIAFAVHESLILESIGTALFSSRGENRYGFAHQTFMESMAAEYLKDFPLAQLRQLLCQHDGGEEHVVPQLAELAAWLAGEHLAFSDSLIKDEPETLLRGDIAVLPPDRKAKLVERLLEKAQNDEAFDTPGTDRFYAGLNHPGLTQQLLPLITNRSANFIARRMAIRIAGACRLTALMDVLLTAILDVSEQADLKRFIAETLEEVTPSNRLGELTALAEGLPDDDDDNIKASALQAMVPRHLSVGQAVPYLTPRRTPNHLGGYWTLLHSYIPTHIQPRDVVPVLGLLAERGGCFDTGSTLKAIADKTFLLALGRLDESEVVTGFVTTWLAKIRNHQPLPLNNAFAFFTAIQADHLQRRRVVSTLINSDQSEVGESWRMIPHELIEAGSDLPWLLECLTTCTEACRPKWVELIGRKVSPDIIAQHWDLFLAAMEQSLALRNFYANQFRAWHVDEPMARKAKAAWLREGRMARRWSRPERPSVEPTIAAAIASGLAGEFNQWVRLADLLYSQHGRHQHGSEYFDVTESPGWTNTTEERRADLREIARAFLLQAVDIRTDNRWTMVTYAGVKAVYLFVSEIESDADLRAAVAQHWLETILDSRVDSDLWAAATAVAYRLNPTLVENRLIRTLTDNAYDGRRLLRALKPCWNSRISEITSNCLMGEPNPEIFRGVFKFLSLMDVPAALGCLDALMIRYGEPSDMSRLQLVITAGLEELPVETWPRVKSRLGANRPFADAIFLQIASSSEGGREHKSLTNTAEETGELYQLVSELFPISGDPSFHGEMGPRHEAAVFRNRILTRLTAMGTDSACHELQRLAAALPEQRGHLQWAYRECLGSMRKQLWQPATPEMILAMAQSAGTRLVRNEQDLANVVMESLDRFQASLVGTNNPQVSALWNYQGNGNNRTNFTPRDEEDLSDRIAGWLQTDLGPSRGIIFNREVQPRRGTRTDILVQAVAPNGSNYRTISVVIEVKGCWNPGVRTSLQSQLIETYLVPNGWTHGIYLVGWFLCEPWQSNRPRCRLASSTLEAARTELEQMAAVGSDSAAGIFVKGYVLDCRLN